ncbi:ribonuclease HI family protein [Candidatus Peregrinibacteria bacterium]|nr:ribonuclease HI family protein [Candidatus Peregrinibacteria bacterium]
MIRLPSSIEKKLKEFFPDPNERSAFVEEAIAQALKQATGAEEEDLPESIGGTLHLFTDGGSRGNPGQAAIAAILEDPIQGKVIREHYERIGIETNNVAEYRALIEGLKIAKRYMPNRLICHLDSELIVKQLSGEYRVKMATLEPLFKQIQALAMEFPDIVFKHIPREDNHRADRLVNKALDEHPSPHYEPPGKSTKFEFRNPKQ